ncbi:ribonuclease H-like domain-containing protein [Pholiota molesta]|nr:ribonuclease H-like domain-containing protein [Pholiota molesta]
MPPQIWGHEFFFEHPSAKLLPKVREAWTSDKLDRKKAFCFRCYDAYYREEVRRDQEEVHNQTRAAARDKETIDAITASCGFPYRWVENPEWVKFLNEFLPLARHLSRLAQYRNDAKTRCAGTLATMQCDGWSGINFHHFLAFMITTSKREVHTVKVFDTSSERKTAEALFGEIQQVRDLLRDEWKVTVVAMTSDAAGESKKARRLLVEADPSLIAPDCWAHQNALVVGDYMRVSGTQLLPCAEQANTVITWLRSKTQILALMRGIQEGIRATNPAARVLTVIRPVVTRWTAFYLAYTRLLELYWVLDILVRTNRERLLTGNAASRRKGLETIAIIQNGSFWTGLTRITKHLEPLARTSCVLQATHARLDQVPIVFGSLLLEYQKMKDDLDIGFGSETLLDTIESSIERRWKSCDQDVYIAAIILNPELKTRPFAQIPLLAPVNIWKLVQRLWKRFYKADAPNSLFTELADYLNNRGLYDGLPTWVDNMSKAAKLKVRHLFL